MGQCLIGDNFMPKDDRILNKRNKNEEIENKLQDTRDKILKTVIDRKKSEKDYLETIKKQKKYWEDQLKRTDPKEDKKRYDRIIENIDREKSLIIQIKEELNRIDKEFKMEIEHMQKEKEREK